MTRVFLSPTRAGGCSIYRNLDAQTTGAMVKAAPGQLYGWQIKNAAAAVRFVKIYNKATAPTGADTPLLTIGLAAGGDSVLFLPQGARFSAGISIRGTQLVADADATAPAANDIVVNLFWV